MSSLKMTFSLASLFLILGLVFATAPAMAQATINRTLDIGNSISDDAGNPDNGGITDNISNVVDSEGSAVTAIPAGGYLVIRKADNLTNAGLPTLPDNAIVARWEDMPDLEALFFDDGGTILLQVGKTNVNDAGTAATSGRLVGLKPPHTDFAEYRYDHDGDDDGVPALTGVENNPNDGIKDGSPTGSTATTHPASVAIDPRVDDLSITEVMWALNNAIINQTGDENHQWIEIHNRNENAALPLAGLVLKIKSGDPPLGFDSDKVDGGTANQYEAATDAPARIGVDRIENVSAVGKSWLPKGQNGSDNPAITTDTLVPFVSMYRNRGKLGKDEGSNIGHWTASTQVYLANHQGTPGKVERAGVAAFTTKGFTLGDVLINEVGNTTNKKHEWIELKGPAGKVLENWQVSVLTGVGKEVPLFTLPKKGIPANGHLLVVNSDPSGDGDHPLAAGWNIMKDADGQVEGVASQADAADRRHVAHYIVKTFESDGLPDGDFVLVLRSGNDKIK